MKKKALSFLLLTFLCQICFSSNLVFARIKKAKVYTPYTEQKYQQKFLKQEVKEKYKRSLLPESGCMTTEEYENASAEISNSDIAIPEYKLPKDIKMKYVPQPTYKLVRYNNPPGSVELHLPRRLKFDRQVNCGAITSPNKDILVYPVVYYYVNNQCTAGDLFVVPLDKSLPDVPRVLRANIVKRVPEPILSTEKNISEKFIFRTMTPVDFSPDGSKLVVKEKIGNINDGIWKTNLWVYDFNTKQARQIPEIRDAIRFFWKNSEDLALDEKRWDILPLGFDSTDPNRVVVSAYGYTGTTPKFLGNWSIDCNGERTMLVSLFEAATTVSINGFKTTQDDVLTPADVYNNEKKEDKIVRQKRKLEKKAKKQVLKQKKTVKKQELKEIKTTSTGAKKSHQIQMKGHGPTE